MPKSNSSQSSVICKKSQKNLAILGLGHDWNKQTLIIILIYEKKILVWPLIVYSHCIFRVSFPYSSFLIRWVSLPSNNWIKTGFTHKNTRGQELNRIIAFNLNLLISPAVYSCFLTVSNPYLFGSNIYRHITHNLWNTSTWKVLQKPCDRKMEVNVRENVKIMIRKFRGTIKHVHITIS